MARQQLGALASQPKTTATIRNQLPERRGKCLPNGLSVLRGLWLSVTQQTAGSKEARFWALPPNGPSSV